MTGGRDPDAPRDVYTGRGQLTRPGPAAQLAPARHRPDSRTTSVLNSEDQVRNGSTSKTFAGTHSGSDSVRSAPGTPWGTGSRGAFITRQTRRSCQHKRKSKTNAKHTSVRS